jgi:cysteine-rich repeat protein
MAPHRTARAVLAAVGCLLLVRTVLADDLAGRWRADIAGEPAQFVEITQVGSMVTIPISVGGMAGQLSGVISGAEFELSGSGFDCPSNPQPILHGVSLPDGSLDALFANICLDYVFARLQLTRCGCFDANSVPGDGCDASCQIEPCYTCSGDPSHCTPSSEGEACDDRHDCTSGETCSGGVCGGGSAVEPCVDMTGLWRVHMEIAEFPGVLDQDATLNVTQRNGVVHLGPVPMLFEYRGGIDRATGAFSLGAPNIQFFFDCPFLSPLTGTATATAFDATGYYSTGRPGDCGAFAALVSGVRTVCGDGVVSDGEACDDGNGFEGDGCDGNCAVEPCNSCSGAPSHCVPDEDGSLCSDDNACTTGDVCQAGRCESTVVACGACEACDPADGSCVGAPLPYCVSPSAPRRSTLMLRDRSPDSGDMVSWTWARGDFPAYDLGRPVGGAQYTLCVYDESGESPALLFRAGVPAGPIYWRENARLETHVYANPGAAPDGITGMLLEVRGADRARATVRGKGPLLSGRQGGLPALPLSLPLRVQLQSTVGGCFEARYDATSVLENNPLHGLFRARAAR